MAEGSMIEPPQKKAKLSLKLKKPLREVQNTMFPSPISEEVFSEAAKGVVNANRKKCTSWAVPIPLLYLRDRARASFPDRQNAVAPIT